MFILDTDSITRAQRRHPILTEKVKNTPHRRLFTTSVTAEELLKGRLAYIHRNRASPKLVIGHADLVSTLTYLREWQILLYDDSSHAEMANLKKQGIRIGSQDLRVAAVTLFHGFTLVTCNRRDFAQVPNLKFEDWTIGQSDE